MARDTGGHSVKIIALTGLPGVGKDLIYSLIHEHAARALIPAGRIAFADPVKAEIAEAFELKSLDPLSQPFTKSVRTVTLAIGRCLDFEFEKRAHEVLAGRGENPKRLLGVSRTPREILQLWATEYRRNQHDNYWIRKAQQSVDTAQRNGFKLIVFTDLRFQNEARWLNDVDATLWRVTRVGIKTPENPHVSDIDLDDWPVDLELSNGGIVDTQDLLRKKVFDCVSPILESLKCHPST